MTRIPFILLSTNNGSPITGAAPTVTISKDGGVFASATNTPAEIGNGYYYIDLTTAETTVTSNVIVRATATGAQPTAVVWEPEPTVPTAADNATAVWGASSRTLTNLNIQSELTTYGAAKTTDLTGLATSQDITNSQAVIIGAMPTTAGLATAAALTTVGDNVTAIKAKTDTIPQNPAAVGSAMTLTEAYDAAKTASQFDASADAVNISITSVQAVQSGLSTFDAANDPVTITTAQAATFATAEAQAAQTTALDKLAASILHWAATASTLTLYDNTGAAIGSYALTRDSSGNITAIEPEEANG